MSATGEATEPVSAVEEAEDLRPCLDVEGSKVYAEVSPDGVLVVRVYPRDGTPAAVYFDETLVAGGEASRQPRGRHRKADA